MTTTDFAAPDGDIPPLACVPGAIPADIRHAHSARLSRLFTASVRERSTLADGYAYRFDATAFDELASWITHERRCCPFLRFALEVTPGDGPLLLRLTGPAGTHAFLDAELPAFPPNGVAARPVADGARGSVAA